MQQTEPARSHKHFRINSFLNHFKKGRFFSHFLTYILRIVDMWVLHNFLKEQLTCVFNFHLL